MYAVDTANKIVGSLFFFVDKQKIIDNKGNVVCNVNYDSPTISQLMDYWQRNKEVLNEQRSRND